MSWDQGCGYLRVSFECESACVSEGDSTEGSAVRPRTLVYACVRACVRHSETATEIVLWPWGFICPGTRNWGDWSPETATGQAGFMRPVAGTTHTVCIYG